jgi:hypothetical protein
MIELWKILIDDTSELTDIEARFAWNEKQKQLEGLLSLILETSTLSIIEKQSALNATQQYVILKNEYNKISISTFATHYRRIFRCSLINHKSIREYDDEICDATSRNESSSTWIDWVGFRFSVWNRLKPKAKNPNHWVSVFEIRFQPSRTRLKSVKKDTKCFWDCLENA